MQRNISKGIREAIRYVAIFSVTAFSVLLLSSLPDALAAGSYAHTVRGFAWSPSVGWISFSCDDTSSCGQTNYGVDINDTTGALSGYAWSPSIGWISFNSNDVANCPDQTSPCAPKVNPATGVLTGFARAVSAMKNENALNLPSSNGNGNTGNPNPPGNQNPPVGNGGPLTVTMQPAFNVVMSFNDTVVLGVNISNPSNFTIYNIEWKEGGYGSCDTAIPLKQQNVSQVTLNQNLAKTYLNEIFWGYSMFDIYVRVQYIDGSGQYIWTPCMNRKVAVIENPTLFPSFPSPIGYNPLNFTIGDTGYMGFSNWREGSFWKYVPIDNQFTQITGFPGQARGMGATYGGVAFPINGKVYMGLGSNYLGAAGPTDNRMHAYDIFRDMWEYDPSKTGASAWTRMADFPQTNYQGLGYFTIGDIGYRIVENYQGKTYSDLGNSNSLRGLIAYTPLHLVDADPTGIQSNISYFPVTQPATLTTAQRATPTIEVWKFDPNNGANGRWSKMNADFPGVWRTNVTAFNIGSKGYVGFGANSTATFNDFWEFDPAGASNNARWKGMASLPTYDKNGVIIPQFPNGAPASYPASTEYMGRSLASGFSYNGKGYVHSGLISQSASTGQVPDLQSIYEFDPTNGAKGTWKKTTLRVPDPWRQGGVQFLIGGQYYFGLGRRADTQPSYDFYNLDMDTLLGWRKVL